MDLIAWLAEPLRLWIEGAPWSAIQATYGFQTLVIVACALVPASIIALGFGVNSWRELPVAWFLGFRPTPPEDDSSWAERARDLDKDGAPDF